MDRYIEVEDIDEIDRLNKVLASKLQSLSLRHEPRKINTVAVTQPNLVYFLGEGIWWSHRLFPVAPRVPTQYNNLFGYGRPGALGSKIEVNFPIGKFRRGRLQGAFARRLETNSVFLAHRGGVQHGRQSFSILDAIEKMGAPLINVSGNASQLITVCSVEAPQLEDIRGFVKNVDRAKNA